MDNKIYINYVRYDFEFAKRLAKDLRLLGFNISADFLNLRPGDQWASTIQSEQDDANIHIVCVSRMSTQSEWLKKNLQYLWLRKEKQPETRIIPILLDDIAVGDLDALPTFSPITQYEVIRLYGSYENYENCLETLLRSLAAPRIFISYRRDDSAEVCDRIYEKLSDHFGAKTIVRDIENIPLGIDFRDYLANVIRLCAVSLVIIGKEWANIRDEITEQRRLDNPADFVRLEIEAALKRDIAVIPILVMGAAMPLETDLPESLSSIVYRNGVSIRRAPDFQSDIERLIKGIEVVLTNY